MNSRVALPIAAAVPTSAPTGTYDSHEHSRAGTFARAEQMVRFLRKCYVRDGWKIDDTAAQRALAFCRKYEEDGSDPEDERMAAIDFFCSHGQSLDWVFRGDVRGMICGLAAQSERSSSILAGKSDPRK